MRLPNFGSEATGGTAQRPAFREPDILHEKFFNQMLYSLYHLLEQAGVEAAGDFDPQDVRTYSRVFEAINDLQGAREIGKLGFRICDPAKLSAIAPNELVPAGQELVRSDYRRLFEVFEQSGCMVGDFGLAAGGDGGVL